MYKPLRPFLLPSFFQALDTPAAADAPPLAFARAACARALVALLDAPPPPSSHSRNTGGVPRSSHGRDTGGMPTSSHGRDTGGVPRAQLAQEAAALLRPLLLLGDSSASTGLAQLPASGGSQLAPPFVSHRRRRAAAPASESSHDVSGEDSSSEDAEGIGEGRHGGTEIPDASPSQTAWM